MRLAVFTQITVLVWGGMALFVLFAQAPHIASKVTVEILELKGSAND